MKDIMNKLSRKEKKIIKQMGDHAEFEEKREKKKCEHTWVPSLMFIGIFRCTKCNEERNSHF